MSIEARPSTVAIDATSMIVARLPVFNTPVAWAVVGNGTLEPLSTITDGNGTVAAKLTPTGSPGDAIQVTVSYLPES